MKVELLFSGAINNEFVRKLETYIEKKQTIKYIINTA